MYVENEDGNEVGALAAQQAEKIAAAIESDREKGRKFLREMGEDDSDEALDALVKSLISEVKKTPPHKRPVIATGRFALHERPIHMTPKRSFDVRQCP
jgi:hypothetical protein